MVRSWTGYFVLCPYKTAVAQNAILLDSCSRFWSSICDTHKIPGWTDLSGVRGHHRRRMARNGVGGLASGVSGAVGSALVQAVLVPVLLPMASVRMVVRL